MAEDMEIDHIVEVPDTPDRVTVRGDDQKYLSNPDKRGRAFNAANEKNNHSNFITLSPSEESNNTSQNAPIFRRALTEKILQREVTHSAGSAKMEKGKSVSSQVPSKTLMGPNVCVDHGPGISLSNDSQSQNKKQVFLPPRLSTTPRGRGHKRLVRNGCISPHNIATREKQIAEQINQQTKDVAPSHVGHLASSNTVSPVSVDDIIAGERGNGRMKGKEVINVRHPSSRGLTFRNTSSPMTNCEEVNDTSNALRNAHHYCEIQDGWRTTHNERNANWHLHDVDGHLHMRRNNDVGKYNRQNSNRMDRRNSRNDQSNNHLHGSQSDHTAQPTSVLMPAVDQSSVSRPGPKVDILTKRQRKRESPLGNPNESPYNSGIMLPGSYGESSSSSLCLGLDPDVVELVSTPRDSSSSSRSRVLDPEVIELLSTPRGTNRTSEDIDDNDNNSSEARERQVEADERLARELQEQLYHDDSFEGFEGRGIDEHLAWELQRAEHRLHTSIDIPDINHPTRFPRANRQPRTRSHLNPSRRRDMPQVPFSNRMSHWRSRVANRTRSSTISSRGRGPRFPLDMDLDLRLDILEALEDSVGDFGDMGMADNIFNVGRDFNEADYEMLLALDERNHQHTGASANLINSLPESTIQTDNFTEDCAICLETPVKGQTIRHLPCLHKFHKDCIDPWLRQKTSCPVCKSSITY